MVQQVKKKKKKPLASKAWQPEFNPWNTHSNPDAEASSCASSGPSASSGRRASLKLVYNTVVATREILPQSEEDGASQLLAIVL